MKAKVAYTYKWTDREINGMPAKVFHQYWLAITALEAEDMLRGFKMSVYPHLKNIKAKELFSSTKRLIGRVINRSNGKLASYDDVVNKLQGLIDHGRR